MNIRTGNPKWLCRLNNNKNKTTKDTFKTEGGKIGEKLIVFEAI